MTASKRLNSNAGTPHRYMHKCHIAAFVFAVVMQAAFAQQPAGSTVLTDRIDFIAPDGSFWSAARSGDNFLLVGRDGGNPPFLAQTLSCVGHDGQVVSARWNGSVFLVSRPGV